MRNPVSDGQLHTRPHNTNILINTRDSVAVNSLLLLFRWIITIIKHTMDYTERSK